MQYFVETNLYLSLWNLVHFERLLKLFTWCELKFFLIFDVKSTQKHNVLHNLVFTEWSQRCPESSYHSYQFVTLSSSPWSLPAIILNAEETFTWRARVLTVKNLISILSSCLLKPPHILQNLDLADNAGEETENSINLQ